MEFPPNIKRSIRQFEKINKKKYVDKKCLLYLIIYIYIYIYTYALFGPVKPERGVIPSRQENNSKVNI